MQAHEKVVHGSKGEYIPDRQLAGYETLKMD